MFKVFVDYPTYEQEFRIAESTTSGATVELAEVLQRDEILQLQDVVRRVPAPATTIHFALDVVRRSRPGRDAPPLINRMVTFGAGPRAVQFLLLGGKARAVIQGRNYVATDDIRALARPVLRHRIITNYAAEAEGYSADRLIEHLLDQTPVRAAGELARAGAGEVLSSA